MPWMMWENIKYNEPSFVVLFRIAEGKNEENKFEQMTLIVNSTRMFEVI